MDKRLKYLVRIHPMSEFRKEFDNTLTRYWSPRENLYTNVRRAKSYTYTKMSTWTGINSVW